MLKTPKNPSSLAIPATPLPSHPHPSRPLLRSLQMEFLNNDEQEILWQYRAAQARPAPVATLSPLSTQIPLSRPSARRACTPSSVASPLAQATSLPIERLAQRRATKRHRSIIESGTEDSGAEGTYGGAESTYSGAELETPVDPVLQNSTSMYEAFAKPSCIDTAKDITHLFAEHDAFMSQLLLVIGTMARQIKELQVRGDTQAILLVRSGAKTIKVRRSPLEQQLTNLAKVRTRNYECPLISHRVDRLEHTLLSSVCLTTSRPPKKRYRLQDTYTKMRTVWRVSRFLTYQTGPKDQGQGRMRDGLR